MRLWHKVVGQKDEDAWGAGADGDPQEARRQGGAETRGCFSKRPPPPTQAVTTRRHLQPLGTWALGHTAFSPSFTVARTLATSRALVSSLCVLP